MSKPKKVFTKEEKLEIVKQSLEEGQVIQDLADRFEVSHTTIYNWRKTYLKHKDISFPGKGNKMQTKEEKKIEKLEKELREAKLERDILKKAVGIFSKTDGKFSNS